MVDLFPNIISRSPDAYTIRDSRRLEPGIRRLPVYPLSQGQEPLEKGADAKQTITLSQEWLWYPCLCQRKRPLESDGHSSVAASSTHFLRKAYMQHGISKSKFGLLAGCFFFLPLLPALAQSPSSPTLPLFIPPKRVVSLSDNQDPQLQQKLESILQNNRLWASLLSKEKMAVGLVDLENPEAPRYASINGSTMLYAASLPKIGILLAISQALEDGGLAETQEVVKDLHDMIRYSSNQAATRLIDLLGFEKIAATLTDSRYKLFDPQHGGGLWVGKRYAKTGRYFPDPIKGLSHAATVEQVCKFYYLLATGNLVSFERSRQMLDAMGEPGIHHKFVRALDEQGSKAHVYRKSGTWSIWHADSMLVWGQPGERYILVGLVEDYRGGQILRELVPAAQNALARSRPRVTFKDAEDS